MVLSGAELLLYPTAIGSEPEAPDMDSSGHWERTMVGHSAANMVPVIACNRIGSEIFPKSSITFYGQSSIAVAVLMFNVYMPQEAVLLRLEQAR
jgi:N-carbamoylputrescine amidase